MNKTILNTYVGTMLDMLEMELDGHPRWPAIRAKILKLFGNNGLMGEIQDSGPRGIPGRLRHVDVTTSLKEKA